MAQQAPLASSYEGVNWVNAHINKLGDDMKKQEVTGIMASNAALFKYGSMFSAEKFREMFKIDNMSNDEFIAKTRVMNKSEVHSLLSNETLKELAVVDVVKNILHENGKHIHKINGSYRIAIPSENEQIAAKYRSKANRALRRAKKLMSSTPITHHTEKTTNSSLHFLMEE